MTTIYLSKTEKTDLPTRQAAELYPTESTLIAAALEMTAPPKADSILDPGAGDGRWGAAAAVRYNPRPALVGCDIRQLPPPRGFDGWHIGDFTRWEPGQQFDLIVGNPPYGDGGRPPLAERFIRHAWSLLAPGGQIVFLLRLALMSGVGRAESLWRDLPPVEVLICSRRPSFYGGGTNATDYGVYVWHKSPDGVPVGEPGRWGCRLLMHERETESAAVAA